jgi:battenin
VPLAAADNAEGIREDDDPDGFEGEEDDEDQFMADSGEDSPPAKSTVTLSANDKWRLVKPLLARYMVPLCASLSLFWMFIFGFPFFFSFSNSRANHV